MADPPPACFFNVHDVELMEEGNVEEAIESDLHSLKEIEELKRNFLNQARQWSDVDVDVAAEYRKEMEADRIADIKNGHLVDNLEVKWVPSSHKNQKNQSETSSMTRNQPAACVPRRSARVLQRVAEFESRLSPRVSGERMMYDAADERGEKGSGQAKQNGSLQGYLNFNSVCLQGVKKREVPAVQCGGNALFLSKNDTTAKSFWEVVRNLVHKP